MAGFRPDSVTDDRHARGDLDRALAFVAAHDLAGYAQHLIDYRARLGLDLGDWAGAEQDARAALTDSPARWSPRTHSTPILTPPSS